MTATTHSPICHECVSASAPPARPRVRKISSGAYATDDNASLAKMGRASFLGSSVSPSRSLRIARPTSTRLRTRPEVATANTLGVAKGCCVRAAAHRARVRGRGARRCSVPVVHFVIMGCGRVGSSLALSLESQGHDVAVIDQEESAFRRLGSAFEGSRVTGVGFDRDTLIEAGIADAYAFAAVSSGDNSNILAARVARETFGVEHVVARIYDPGRA